MIRNSQQKSISGWREWLALPELNIPGIEANIDIASESSTLHTSFVEHYRQEGELWVRFGVNPLPQREEIRIVCQAPVKNQKTIPVSEYREETLFVIESTVNVGQRQSSTELVLKRKQSEGFSLHLGRNALRGLDILIDPLQSHCFGQPDESVYNSHLKAC